MAVGETLLETSRPPQAKLPAMLRIALLLVFTGVSFVLSPPVAVAFSESATQNPAPSDPPPLIAAPVEPEVRTVSIEDEVLGNLRSQPIGPATLDDLALPEDFLKRVGDRVIRASFEERYRIVVPDPKPEDAKKAADAVAKPGQVSTTQTPGNSRSTSVPLIVMTAFSVMAIALYLSRRRRSGGAA